MADAPRPCQARYSSTIPCQGGRSLRLREISNEDGSGVLMGRVTEWRRCELGDALTLQRGFDLQTPVAP